MLWFVFVGVVPIYSASIRQIFQSKSHQCPLEKKTTHQTKHTHLHFGIPSTQIPLIPINRLFAQ